jgi:hypothetical protein
MAMIAAIQMLDAAGEDQVDPDFAVDVQQIMGGYLNELSQGDSAELERLARRMAAERSTSDPVIARYLLMLADGLPRSPPATAPTSTRGTPSPPP